VGGVDGGQEDEYKNWAWHDARLTDTGRAQAEALMPVMSAHALDVVFVSPLSRTIQTALLAIPAGPPFVVLDMIRERNGAHPCDKRRPKAELAADFPRVDFSPLSAEEDDSWTPEREPLDALVARAGDFLRFAAARAEHSIAIVTHNDFLQALLLEAPELRVSEPGLRRKFANAECMALWLSWSAPGDTPSAASPHSDRAQPEFSPRAF
jgi:broad specificity phosphatase PhoE